MAKGGRSGVGSGVGTREFLLACFPPPPQIHLLRPPLEMLRPRHNSTKLRIPAWLLRTTAGERAIGLQRRRTGVGRLISSMSEMDASSLDEISRIEPPERPPSIDQLDQLTGHRFSHRWLKYIYNRFKNVRLTLFQQRMYFLAVTGMPNRKNAFCRVQAPLWRLHPGPTECKYIISRGFCVNEIWQFPDGYFERMFTAFCQNSTHPDQLTFQVSKRPIGWVVPSPFDGLASFCLFAGFGDLPLQTL